jgi:hypothetical protein
VSAPGVRKLDTERRQGKVIREYIQGFARVLLTATFIEDAYRIGTDYNSQASSSHDPTLPCDSANIALSEGHELKSGPFSRLLTGQIPYHPEGNDVDFRDRPPPPFGGGPDRGIRPPHR